MRSTHLPPGRDAAARSRAVARVQRTGVTEREYHARFLQVYQEEAAIELASLNAEEAARERSN